MVFIPPLEFQRLVESRFIDGVDALLRHIYVGFSFNMVGSLDKNKK